MESLGFLEFGPFRIDCEQRLLFRGGEVVPTAPKAFETLLVLVENHGRVVSKDDLLKRVWPDTFVEEGSLARNVSILRKLLGENADDQAFIETIPKRGYRFVAPVTAGPRFPFAPTTSVQEPAPASAPRFHPGRAVGLVLATIAALATGLGAWRLLSGRPPAAERASSIPDLELTRIPNSENAIGIAISGDGKFMTFVDQTRADEGPSVKVRQLSNNEDRTVVAPSTIIGSDGSTMPAMIWGVSVAPDDGSIYFVRSTDLLVFSIFRVPFQGSPSTTPTRIADDVRTTVGWRADGKQMAFIRLAPGQSESLVVAEADGSHEQVLATRTRPAGFETFNSDVFSAPAWSPDGKTIAILGHDTKNDKRVWEIVLVDAADGSERTTIRMPGRPTGLGWLDNDELLLTSREKGGPSQVWRVSSSGGQRSKMTNQLSDYLELSLTADRDTMIALRGEDSTGIWIGHGDGRSMSEFLPRSADIDGVGSNVLTWAGDRLLYTSREKGNVSIMSVVPGSGVSPEVLIANAYAPSATSDGKAIVFQSLEDSPRTNLWKSDGDGRNRKQIVSGSVNHPLVTPDDRFVVYRSTGGDMDTAFYVPIDGGTPQEIIHEPIVNPPSFSPDGKQMLFLTRSASMKEPKAFICDFPACRALRAAPRWGKWMPDGKRIAVSDDTRDLGNIWAYSIDGSSPPKPFTQFKEVMGLRGLEWTRDGKRLAVARGGGRGDVVLFKGMKRMKASGSGAR